MQLINIKKYFTIKIFLIIILHLTFIKRQIIFFSFDNGKE